MIRPTTRINWYWTVTKFGFKQAKVGSLITLLPPALCVMEIWFALSITNGWLTWFHWVIAAFQFTMSIVSVRNFYRLNGLRISNGLIRYFNDQAAS